jgi:hypothetical protein
MMLPFSLHIVVGAAPVLAALLCGAAVSAADQTPALPSEETRAVTYLTREVPLWKRENDCYSCHNNGDAARALIVASARGHAVGTAIDDTLEWLRHPERWDKNKTEGGVDDKPLARVQFASALRVAGAHAKAEAGALRSAAEMLAADQTADGSWQFDSSQSVGSPTTYGIALATTTARRVLVDAGSSAVQPAIAKADAWLRAVKIDSVLDAASIVLGLEHVRDDRAVAQRRRALAILRKGQAPSGGWGPYITVAPEVFDTALVLLALDGLTDQDLNGSAFGNDTRISAIAGGRKYLIAQQAKDGSWPETTRPSNQESYAQRISTTGWALLALLETR